MRTKTRCKVTAIHAASAEEFNAVINAELEKANNPRITYMQGVPFAAYIEYKYTEEIPETLAEKYELMGKGETCGGCPFFVKSTDKRCTWHYCAQYGKKTKETTPACDALYELKEATK